MSKETLEYVVTKAKRADCSTELQCRGKRSSPGLD